MIAVMIIPTGIGCEIGGHAGDASPAAKLLAACCDKLILHPNVVNASDINEMPANALYVEGSAIDEFLAGAIQLCQVKQNRIIVTVNAPARSDTINAVSAARATIGADIEIVELRAPLEMSAEIKGNVAGGTVRGWLELCEQVKQYSFDALAIATPIYCDKDLALGYFRNGGINPWGKIEAITSALIARRLRMPVAHAPVETDEPELKFFEEIVDPRIAAEVVSTCYLHCVLKGLHRAPRIVAAGLSNRDVDALITPIGCVGPAHESCLKSGIPVIAVKENKTALNDPMPKEFIIVDNYLEAAGYLMAIRAGVCPASTRRPLLATTIKRVGCNG
jgi:hypothetical protein